VKGNNAVFRKNKPTPPPFVVQVLTTEYLIEGTAQGECLYRSFSRLDAWSPLRLTSVQITPTGPTQVPAQSLPLFMVSGNSVVASCLVQSSARGPTMRCGPSTRYLPRHIPHGPYLIRGTMMFLREDCVEEVMPMFGVQIRHTVPGAALGELSARSLW